MPYAMGSPATPGEGSCCATWPDAAEIEALARMILGDDAIALDRALPVATAQHDLKLVREARRALQEVASFGLVGKLISSCGAQSCSAGTYRAARPL